MANLIAIPISASVVPVGIYQEAAAFTGDHPQADDGELSRAAPELYYNKFPVTDKAGLFFFNAGKPVVLLQANVTIQLAASQSPDQSATEKAYSAYVVDLNDDGDPLDGRDGRADTRMLITHGTSDGVVLLGQGMRVILGPKQALQIVTANPDSGAGNVRGHVWGMFLTPSVT